MPTAKNGGAQAYVRGTLRSVSTCSAVPIPVSKLSSALSLLSKSNSTTNDLKQTPPPAYTTIYPPTPPSSAPSSPDSLILQTIAPRPASTRSNSQASKPINVVTAATPVKPQLTPRSSTDAAPKMMQAKRNVLTQVFAPSSAIHQLQITPVDVSEISSQWKGTVVDNPEMATRSLFISGGSYEDVNLREAVCDVFEKAEEELGCTGVVMCLEKNSPDLGELVHQLLYLGGTITSSPFAPNSAYILVGMEL